MEYIKQININGVKYQNVPFEAKQLKELGLTDAEIAAEKAKLDLIIHVKNVGVKVGAILSAVTKDLQTQSNIQAKFSLIDTKEIANQTAQEKAIHAAIIKLAEWNGDVLVFGNTLKLDIDADIEGAAWPELDAQSAAVIAALVAEL